VDVLGVSGESNNEEREGQAGEHELG
jgi:hypothetical protein